MYRRKHPEEDDENHERWLISYADFITLLFAFFVVMYATSTINLNKYRALSNAVVTAFQGTPGQPTTLDAQTQMTLQNQSSVIKPLPLSYLYQEKKQRDQEKIHAIGQTMANALEPWIEQKLINVFQSELGIEIDIQSQLLFNNHQTSYAAQANDVLKALSAPLKNEFHAIQVEGHCDRQVFSDRVDADAKRWELSAAQAAHFVASLIDSGVTDKRLSAIGLADTKPVSSSDNPFAQAMNSRLTLRILTAESSAQLSNNLSKRQAILPGASTMAPALPETGPHTDSMTLTVPDEAPL